MLRRYLALPTPLRTQVAVRLLLAFAAFCAGAFAFVNMSWMVSLPMLFICAALSAGIYALLSGKYLLVTGICVKIERNLTHSRPKWIILKNEQCVLRIRSQKRHSQVRLGDAVAVYLRPDARLYELDGMYTVYDYIALKSEGVLHNG